MKIREDIFLLLIGVNLSETELNHSVHIQRMIQYRVGIHTTCHSWLYLRSISMFVESAI